MKSSKNSLTVISSTRNFSRKELDNEKGAIGVLSDYKDNTDPALVGPGSWNVIHRQAFSAQTPEKEKQFILLMKDICYGFPCKVCRGHCTEYIKNHPMEDYIGSVIDGKRLGLFIWSWKFHNAVNERLRKPIMSWMTVLTLYSQESKICSAACLAAESED